MSAGEICIIVFVVIWVIIVNIIIWINVDDYNYEKRQERKKARLRKTKAYKLGREEEKSATQESALEMACAMINLSDQEIERLEDKENLSNEEKDKLLKLLRRKVKRLKTTNQNQQLIIETFKSEKDNLMRTIEEAQEKITELENDLFELEEEYGISRNNY